MSDHFDLPERDLAVLRHMLGLDDARDPPDKKPYRNHYCAEEGNEHLRDLAARGLVVLTIGPTKWLPYETYACTPLGIEYACASHRERARTTSPAERRYRAYLNARDAIPDLTFRDFLTDPEFAEARS